MKKLGIICVCIFGMICLNWSCGDRTNSVPVANVNFTVQLHSCELVHVGGYEYFSGAIKGLVVYRVDMTNFCAYDRACPYDWKENGRVSIDSLNPFELICDRCQSTFNILTGYPIGTTKADAPLRAYKATLINDFNLRISNY